jgi:NHL repeat
MSFEKMRSGILMACCALFFACNSSNSGDSAASSSECKKILMNGNSTCPLSLSAAVTTLAGDAQGNADGTGTAATFDSPSGVTTDGTNLYVADKNNHRIRKIVIATGAVTTLAGNGSGNADGTGTAATFNSPYGITTDGTNLYVTDQGNHRIRKIVIATGAVTTLAGNGSGNADGTGTAATFNFPHGITTDGTNLYIADESNYRIRKIVIATRVVTTLAGDGQGSADGTGTAATFRFPSDLTSDGTNLYVADRANHRIRKIVMTTGAVTTLAGNALGSTNGTGTAATFNYPTGLTTDGANLYIADQGNHRIRKIQ